MSVTGRTGGRATKEGSAIPAGLCPSRWCRQAAETPKTAACCGAPSPALCNIVRCATRCAMCYVLCFVLDAQHAVHSTSVPAASAYVLGPEHAACCAARIRLDGEAHRGHRPKATYSSLSCTTVGLLGTAGKERTPWNVCSLHPRRRSNLQSPVSSLISRHRDPLALDPHVQAPAAMSSLGLRAKNSPPPM